MTVQEIPSTLYKAVCDDCGRAFFPRRRKSIAEWDLKDHECGVHRQAHDSTGGYRGILGGWNVSCVCGERWVDHDGNTPFRCPKDTAEQERQSRETES